MGKSLIIKGADFSQNSIVPPTPPTPSDALLSTYLAIPNSTKILNPSNGAWVSIGTNTYNLYKVAIPSGKTKIKLTDLGGALGEFATSGWPCFNSEPSIDQSTNIPTSIILGQTIPGQYSSSEDSIEHTLRSGTTWMFITQALPSTQDNVRISFL